MHDQQRQGVIVQDDQVLVQDLAALVKRLAWMLNQKSPHHPLAGSAIEFLKKKGLHGSAFRADE